MSPTTVGFAVPALAVVMISLAVTLAAARRPDRPVTRKRFSGSTVVLRMPSLLRGARLPIRVPVAVVRDAAAAGYYDSPATLDTIVRAWRDALEAIGADVRIVGSRELHLARSARVLVVPSSPCLTVETREAIEKAGDRGQGLVVTGASGAFDAGCRPLGYGLVIGLTDASRAEELGRRQMVYVSIPSAGPLSADIPAGARLDVRPAAQVALRHPAPDAFYSDYTLGSAPADGQPFLDAALVRANYAGARVAYFGFELRNVVRTPWSREIVALLVRNTIAWTGDVPLASVESWPRGRASAAILAQDVEDIFGNARHAMDSLRAAGMPGTYFVTSDLAKRNARLTRRLASSGEVGTHSENHQVLGGLSYERQLERLLTTQRDLDKLLGEPARGLRPPEEQFDEATMAAWLRAGGTYVLGANDARCAAPELLPVRGDTIVLIPRVFGDDFSAAGPGRRRPPAVVDSLMRAEVAKAERLGGLYVLSYHTQLLGRAEYVPVLAGIARELATDSTVWIATADAMAEWSRARASVEARVQRSAPDRLTVVVRNRDYRSLKDATIRVTLPRGRRLARASVKYRDAGVESARLVVPFIPGRSSLRIQLWLAPR
ncbi:MAG TPA: polysaccharide deacetylase family protein [Gemmatimonadaceae bacterium]|nr:polysaccharide deacetylase family protein [Gemmatimonadaceae bacterium]